MWGLGFSGLGVQGSKGSGFRASDYSGLHEGLQMVASETAGQPDAQIQIQGSEHHMQTRPP